MVNTEPSLCYSLTSYDISNKLVTPIPLDPTLTLPSHLTFYCTVTRKMNCDSKTAITCSHRLLQLSILLHASPSRHLLFLLFYTYIGKNFGAIWLDFKFQFDIAILKIALKLLFLACHSRVARAGTVIPLVEQ